MHFSKPFYIVQCTETLGSRQDRPRQILIGFSNNHKINCLHQLNLLTIEAVTFHSSKRHLDQNKNSVVPLFIFIGFLLQKYTMCNLHNLHSAAMVQSSRFLPIEKMTTYVTTIFIEGTSFCGFSEEMTKNVKTQVWIKGLNHLLRL